MLQNIFSCLDHWKHSSFLNYVWRILSFGNVCVHACVRARVRTWCACACLHLYTMYWFQLYGRWAGLISGRCICDYGFRGAACQLTCPGPGPFSDLQQWECRYIVLHDNCPSLVVGCLLQTCITITWALYCCLVPALSNCNCVSPVDMAPAQFGLVKATPVLHAYVL